jgi:hypothetical protein
MLRAKRDYIEKCRRADAAEAAVLSEKARLDDVALLRQQSRPTFIQLGPLHFVTEYELDTFLAQLQRDLPMEDVRFSLFGVYKNSVNGELLVEWLLQQLPDQLPDRRAAEEVGQAMVDQGYLKVVGLGSTFQGRPNSYYQWKRLASDPDEEEHRKLRMLADEADDVYREAVRKVERTRMLAEQNLVSCLERIK